MPAYLWYFGLDWFQVALFFVMFAACGFSISIGYHRLFSHIAFQAAWPVRLFTLIFGAAAFENSVLMWASEHRRHHKHVDHDDDPYSISKGFFYAHVGWLIFKLHPEGPYDNVSDLRKDPLVVWQDRYVQWIAVVVSFVIPPILGFLWNGWAGALGAFLLAGIARIVALQHCTFFINSACHVFGTAALLDEMQRARFLHHGARHLRRGLPQLSPRVPIRLPQWREALEFRSDQMDHLDAF